MQRLDAPWTEEAVRQSLERLEFSMRQNIGEELADSDTLYGV